MNTLWWKQMAYQLKGDLCLFVNGGAPPKEPLLCIPGFSDNPSRQTESLTSFRTASRDYESGWVVYEFTLSRMKPR